MFIPDPWSGPDPGIKKAPVPGSGSAKLPVLMSLKQNLANFGHRKVDCSPRRMRSNNKGSRKDPKRWSNSPDSESQILGWLTASCEDKTGSPDGSKEGELACEGGGGSSDAVTSRTRLPFDGGGKRSSGGGGRSAEASRMRLPFGVGNGGGSGVGRVWKDAPPVGVVATSSSSDGGKMSLLSVERSSSAGGAPSTRSAAGVRDSCLPENI